MKTSKGSAKRTEPFKLCVCGGRDFDDEKFLYAKLDHLTSKINRPIVVITGGAKGADHLAGQWAYHARHVVVNYHADWKKHGKAAGPIRNTEMLDTEKPDIVVAFPGGSGTADCVRQAKQRNIPVREISVNRTQTTILQEMSTKITEWCDSLKKLTLDDQVSAINEAKKKIHEAGPFKGEPVDFIQWVKTSKVQANDYNPNSVAPPEMQLLYLSIAEDGYTQPIVSWSREGVYEVVDGFHRNRVCREYDDINTRVHGYLPLTVINADRQDRGDRIASTIRHNRARGKHAVSAMSEIVIELKRRNWSQEKIAKELGMDQDEILRLCQISGLAELFSDQQFSQAWDVEGQITEDDFKELSEENDTLYSEDEVKSFRTVNTSDKDRVFHTYDKWECYQAGFYATTKEGMSKEQCELAYSKFLADGDRFKKAVNHVITKWKHSCEHYLTNVAMNRIAWLGQAAACYALGIPSTFRGGWNLLSKEQQVAADKIALDALNKWLKRRGLSPVTMEQADPDRQSEIY